MKDAPCPRYPIHPPTYAAEPKRRCTVTVTEAGWFGAKAAAEGVGCVRLSDMIERLGRGELAILPSDEFPEDSLTAQMPTAAPPAGYASTTTAPYSHSGINSPHPNSLQSPAAFSLGQLVQRLWQPIGQILAPLRRLPRLFLTATCAALILIPVLHVVNLTVAPDSFAPSLVGVPETGDVVAGYDVTDHFRIRPVHPVTGARNVVGVGVRSAVEIQVLCSRVI